MSRTFPTVTAERAEKPQSIIIDTMSIPIMISMSVKPVLRIYYFLNIESIISPGKRMSL